MINPESIRAAETVLDAIARTSRAELAIATYETTSGMEGDTRIQIWHLLFSLMDLCESQKTDFDAILMSARQAFAKDLAGKPDVQIFLLLFDLIGHCKKLDIDFAEIITNLRAERPIVNG